MRIAYILQEAFVVHLALLLSEAGVGKIMNFLERFRLRHATPFDHQKVVDFFERNHHRFNARRGDVELLKAIRENRHLYVLEDGAGAIHGASVVFHHFDGAYREAGATRIIVNGFGLQKVFHYARSVHEYIVDHDFAEYFTVVALDNVKSLQNVQAVGFVDWSQPYPALVAEKRQLAGKQAAGDDGTKPVQWLRLPVEAIIDHAKQLLAVADAAHLSRANRETGAEEWIGLELKLEVLEYHRPVVEQLAGGDLEIHR